MRFELGAQSMEVMILSCYSNIISDVVGHNGFGGVFNELRTESL